jgi:hypothetical protein
MQFPATILAAAAVALLGGCAAKEAAKTPAAVPVVAEAPLPAWVGIATPADSARLARIEEAWSAGIAQMRPRFRRVLDEEGELLDPDGALPRPAPPPGSYHCRVLRIGAPGRGRAFTAFKPFFCNVADAGENLAFTKQTGSDRPGGYLYPDERGDRLIFLGGAAIGDGPPPAYGDDPVRDLIGTVERVGPFRWRLVMPFPRSGAKLEVMELVPALP